MSPQQSREDADFLKGARRYILPVLAAMAGLALGLLVVIAVIFSGLWKSGPSWDAPALLQSMDCSAAGICRNFPNRDHEMRHGGGGTFRVRSNSIGFRGAEPPPPSRAATTLLVQMFGDSMTHGTGVDDADTVAARLREALAVRFPGRQVHVMNLAMPMNYLRSQFTIYETWGRPHRPDVVVFQYYGHIPSPSDINQRVRQIRESSVAAFLFRYAWGRRLLNQYQSLAVTQYSDEEALAALEPGIELLRRDREERGLTIAVFSFISDFNGLEAIFPADLQVLRIGSGLDGWDAYRASSYIIPGDGHPNASGTRLFAERIADALVPRVAAAGAPPS